MTSLLMTLVMATVVGQASSATASSPDARPRIMPLGDSITYGANVPGGYRIELEKLLAADHIDVDFVGSECKGSPAQLKSKCSEGHSGWEVDQIRANIDHWMTRSHPDIVLLLIGTNDLWIRKVGDPAPNVPDIGRRLRLLVDQIQTDAPGVTVVVGSVPPSNEHPAWNRYVEEYNRFIAQMVATEQAADHKVVFADINNGLTAQDLEDGVHPLREGYDKMAHEWFAALRGLGL